MIVTIVVRDKLTPEQISDAFDDKDITIAGKMEAMFFHNDALQKMTKKAEMFDNLVAMGSINSGDLKEVGYKGDKDGNG